MGYLDQIKSAVGIKSTAAPAQTASTDNVPNGNMRFQRAPQDPPNNSNIGLDGNPIQSTELDPNDPNNQNAGRKQEEDRFTKFNKMWDNPTNPEKAPTFTLDPTQLDTIVKSQNFRSGVSPELMERATNGDAKAMIEMMDIVAQNSYRTALEHGSKLTDGFVSAREAYNAKGFGGKIKGELTNAGIASIAGSKNPVVQKQLRQTAESLQKTHPDASPDEIVQMTLEYFQELSAAISGKPAQEDNATAPKATDWDKWFGN